MELYRRFFTREVAVSVPAELRLTNRDGPVSVRSHDVQAIVFRVVAELYADSAAEADAELRRLEQAIEVRGNKLEVTTPDLPRPAFLFFGRGARVEYDVLVPYATSLSVECRNSRIEVRDVEGPVQARNRNGPVVVRKVKEQVEVHNRNGSVTVEDVSGRVTVELANARVVLESIGGEARVRVTNGPVELRNMGGAVHATSANGPLRFEGPIAGHIEMTAVNGGIRLAVPPDSRFEIDAESRNGSVRSDLPVKSQPPASGPLPKVRLRTVNGGIRLVPL